MDLGVDDIIGATGADVLSRGPKTQVCTISTDSRTLQLGDWFVAINGPHFDGHDFVPAAFRQGAAGCIVDRAVGGPNAPDRWCLQVTDTVTALGAIARCWRRRFTGVPCVAITGSNGKSTTKEMAASIAEARGPVLKTEGNFNNLIGLPLTVYRWGHEHRTAVCELGMSGVGEIARLTDILAPDVALITNVTAAHLEQLQTVENVATAKGELFATMRRDGTVCVNMEDPHTRELGTRYPGTQITYGMQNGCDVQFGRMRAEGLAGTELTVYLRGEEKRLRLAVPGIHNVMNALAAMAVGLAIGLPAATICERLPHFQPMRMRMERVQLANGVQVVNDSYNANPDSMAAALRTVGAVKRAGRFIVVLGDMLELGSATEQAHRELGAAAHAAGVQQLFVTGDHGAAVGAGARAAGMAADRIAVVASMDDLQRAVACGLHTGDVILVKGSRGMRMERVVDFLKTEFGTG
ncbi:MAG: UDP-N-acetylmuramoyl-tripeptide--D-alanyl-D-alanine ligase [Deltaproteobacteria bacterium]|nr:UDP-N-acetylmuramoyl-tripeptide--D-alanyl-D-alanine ligase [Deltaproteobacteria bacterium]